MKICLIGPAWPYRGGISHYNTCLARELEKSHEVEIVNFSRLYPEFLFPGKTQYDESSSALTIRSERIIDSINPFTWVRAGFHIARMKPDLTIIQWWHPYFAPAVGKISAILRLFSRTRILMLCHNVIPHERSMIDRFLAHMAFAPAHAFLVQSGEDRDNLIAMKKKAKVRVHPHPIYDFFKSGSVGKAEARVAIEEPDGPLLLFFGYIRPYKGLRYLIEAMPSIRKETGARLLVVGEFYEDSGPYFELVEKLDLSGCVRFVDRYVGNEEVESYFTASDLVVLPYLTATQSGIAQISIAFDRPMIVTGVGGLPEIVSPGKTGFIVPPADPVAIAKEAVSFFLERKGEKMASFFEDEKKRFAWSSLTSGIEELYREL